MKNKGYMIFVEANDANINGDPDDGGMPRVDTHEHALISDVSIKKKIRKYLEFLGNDILETGGRDKKSVNAIKKQEGGLAKRFIDVRLFGVSELEKDNREIHTGPVSVPLARSVAPVNVQTYTHTIERGVEEGKDQGVAPDGFKYFEHAVFPIEISVNFRLANLVGLLPGDLELFEQSLPHLYDFSSRTRPSGGVCVLRIYKWEYDGPVVDLIVRKVLTPTLRTDVEQPVSSDDYLFPSIVEAQNQLPMSLKNKIDFEIIYDVIC